MALAAAAVRLAAAAAAGAASSCTASVDCPLAELLGLRVPPLCQRRGCPMSLPAAGGQGLHGAELCGGGARRIGFPSRGAVIASAVDWFHIRSTARGARSAGVTRSAAGMLLRVGDVSSYRVWCIAGVFITPVLTTERRRSQRPRINTTVHRTPTQALLTTTRRQRRRTRTGEQHAYTVQGQRPSSACHGSPT
jgi:hypothetical protein